VSLQNGWVITAITLNASPQRVGFKEIHDDTE
jgi:hypothetical protein